MDADTIGQDERPLALPAAAGAQQAPPFPVAASLAPLIASGVIWAITQSPFALVFAALSPVIAVASVIDGRWHMRTARKRAATARAAARDRLAVEVEQRHERERATRFARTPTARAVMDPDSRIGRWSAHPDGRTLVTIGTGRARSGLRIDGEPDTPDERALLAAATTLEHGPVAADATGGIGLIGTPILLRALTRGYLIQLVHALSPAGARIVQLPSTGWDWARALPHFGGDPGGPGDPDDHGGRDDPRGPGDPGGAHPVRIFVRSAEERNAPKPVQPGPDRLARPAAAPASRRGNDVVIALAGSLDELPASCAVVVQLTGPASARVLRHPDAAATGPIIPELIVEGQAADYARQLVEHAGTAGLLSRGAELPGRVEFGDLQQHLVRGAESGLAVAIGRGRTGPVSIDLVADGPHAVVGGTTGSGKSEFLTTWVTAMAARYPPRSVAFLLVDFKGGSAFRSLAGLAHCVGLITDLGHGEAERALRSLQAELRYREAELAGMGVRDIDEAEGRFGRLVIVVDEFAAMLQTFPELNELFADIAARGRSLGVHAILCTQRPSGVVRDALLANCALRISLRVNNAVDSVAVVGTDAAARLSATRPGRCIVARDGVCEQVQVARAGVDDIARVVRISAGADAAKPRRPWLDPLPAEIPGTQLGSAPAGEVLLGVEDVPLEQRQSAVAVPLHGTHLLICGAHCAGKTTAARSIRQQWTGQLRTTAAGVEALWDALGWADELCAAPEAAVAASGPSEGVLVLIDDLDALLGRMPQDYRDVALERLTRVLRDGSAAGISIAATVQTVSASLRTVAGLFPQTLLLRQPSRADHVLAGAPAELYDEQARPGSGVWRGNRIQLAWPDAAHAIRSSSGRRVVPAQECAADEPPTLRWGEDPTIVVTRSPAARIRSLREQTAERGDRRVEVIDIDPAEAGRAEADSAPLDAASAPLRVAEGAGPRPTGILVGSPDAWQARWSMFTALRARHTVVFDGCSVAQMRALTQTRELPPLIAGSDRVWVLGVNGATRRARWARERC